MYPKQHVLVVDDNTAFAELVALRLRRLGRTSTVVDSVDAAIAALERERVDLVLSDNRMPGAGGLDLLAYVRCRAPDVPFELMSSNVDDELCMTALDLGAQAVHDKSSLLEWLPRTLRVVEPVAA